MLSLFAFVALGTSVVFDQGVVWQIRDQVFRELSFSQRGAPEEAMLRLQHAQIAQEYGWVCEHVGDLTHRMSEKFSFFQGGYGTVKDKVRKTLRTLKEPYGFRRNLDGQISSNFRYHQEPGNRPWPYPSEAAAYAVLVKLGKDYAAEHRKLVVYNRPQWLAREAAVAMGEMRFPLAERHLEELMRLLDQGDEVWAVEAGRFDGHPYRPPAT